MTASIPLHVFFCQMALQNSKKFWRELAERTTKIFKFEPTKNLGKTRKSLIQNAQYTEGFRVSPVMTASIPLHIFFRQMALQNSKKFWRELAERTTKIFKFEPTKNLGKTRKTPTQNAQYAEGFRVSPVMTASIPLHWNSVVLYQLSGKKSRTSEKNLSRFFRKKSIPVLKKQRLPNQV